MPERLRIFEPDPDPYDGESYPALCARYPLDLQRALRAQEIVSKTPEQAEAYNQWVKGWLQRQRNEIEQLDVLIQHCKERNAVSEVLTDDLVLAFIEGLNNGE
jgi:hypothetical protein